MVKKFKILLYFGVIFLWGACSENSQVQKSIDPVSFDLFTSREMALIVDYFDCLPRPSHDLSDIYFMQVKNNENDTLYTKVYSNCGHKFLKVGKHQISKIQNEYDVSIEWIEYPPISIDTILPFQNRIYPIVLAGLYLNEIEFFSAEPSVYSKKIKIGPAGFKGKFHTIKTPFVFYKIVDSSFVDITNETTEQLIMEQKNW